MEVLEIANTIISLAGISLALYLYSKHDKQLKRQEKTINQFNIEKLESEKSLERRAEIMCEISRKSEKYNATITFYNSGKSDARNVRLSVISDDDGILRDGKWGPYDILEKNRENKREERVTLLEGHKDTMDIEITWDDNSGTNRKIIRHPSFPK